MSKLREAQVTSDVCSNKTSLHEYLQKSLNFPSYYGKNLSALADCLAETSTPTIITFAIDPNTLPPEMQAYLLKLVQVCARESLTNDSLTLLIEHPKN